MLVTKAISNLTGLILCPPFERTPNMSHTLTYRGEGVPVFPLSSLQWETFNFLKGKGTVWYYYQKNKEFMLATSFTIEVTVTIRESRP